MHGKIVVLFARVAVRLGHGKLSAVDFVLPERVED